MGTQINQLKQTEDRLSHEVSVLKVKMQRDLKEVEDVVQATRSSAFKFNSLEKEIET